MWDKAIRDARVATEAELFPLTTAPPADQSLPLSALVLYENFLR